jgi:hypothetical protein
VTFFPRILVSTLTGPRSTCTRPSLSFLAKDDVTYLGYACGWLTVQQGYDALATGMIEG